jgi:hypothetical protein
VSKPLRWNPGDIGRFTVLFGPISSIFDVTAYAVMWWVRLRPVSSALLQVGRNWKRPPAAPARHAARSPAMLTLPLVRYGLLNHFLPPTSWAAATAMEGTVSETRDGAALLAGEGWSVSVRPEAGQRIPAPRRPQ